MERTPGDNRGVLKKALDLGVSEAVAALTRSDDIGGDPATSADEDEDDYDLRDLLEDLENGPPT